MNTDKELLELAAKAAGMGYLIWTPGAAPLVPEEHRHGDRICWHPLSDDGDALRLAVNLNMLVDVMTSPAQSHAIGGGIGAAGEGIEPHVGGDKYAATRRAIVHVAAEIGQRLP